MRAAFAALLLLAACAGRETVPETGRRRPRLRYTEEQMAVLGEQAYAEAIKGYEVIEGTPGAEAVQRVGERIAHATGRHYGWEFKLLDAPRMANAFCLPGGKVAVFSGMLPIAASEQGLAVVIGHEVAHATLQHGNERLSQPALKRIIGLPVAVTAGVWGAISPRSRRAVLGAFGLGELVGKALPYSQEHEWEADLVGLRYMRAAGYDVTEAPAFWRRMAEVLGDEETDALSTHPGALQRADRLERLIRAQGP